jgi:hypothetical protein
MRRSVASLVLVLLALPALATAKLNRTYMVPVYAACGGPANCFPPVLASKYTFDSIVLYSSPQPYIQAGKLALMIVVKGLKDASGAPFTGTLKLRVPGGRVTILSQSIGTLPDGSPLVPETEYDVAIANGSTTHAKFTVPDSAKGTTIVVNSFDAPILYDPDGNELASSGSRSKP